MTRPAPELPRLDDLKSVKQLACEYPHLFTEASLRWLIFNAETNGFAPCIVRIGRRVLIDLQALKGWIAQQRGVAIGRPCHSRDVNAKRSLRGRGRTP